jgi:hypothetical protein
MCPLTVCTISSLSRLSDLVDYVLGLVVYTQNAKVYPIDLLLLDTNDLTADR